MIKATGFASERFMNMLSYRGVYLWDVGMEGAGVQMKAARKDLPMLEMCAEKTGCRLEVLGYGGLPARMRRFRGRQALTAGVLLFSAGLYLLSSFVWVIRVEGNERVDTAEILAHCRDMGLSPGAWKKNVDLEQVTKTLLLDFPDLSWVSVGIKGTDASIKIAETIEKAEMVDKETPCSIVAALDGVILKITAERGTPLVQVGDVVQKGDVLISSTVLIGLEGEEQHEEYVAAEGFVEARVWQSIAEELPLTYEEKVYNGEVRTNMLLEAWGRELDFIRPAQESALADTELLSEKQLGLGDFRLPVSIKKEQYLGYVLEQKSRTVEEARALLEEELTKKVTQQLSEYGTIEKLEVHYEEYTDSVRAQGQAVLIERIDEKQTDIQQPTEQQQTTEEGRDAADGTA